MPFVTDPNRVCQFSPEAIELYNMVVNEGRWHPERVYLTQYHGETGVLAERSAASYQSIVQAVASEQRRKHDASFTPLQIMEATLFLMMEDNRIVKEEGAL